MSRIAVDEAGNSGGHGTPAFSSPEEAMMGRMGILVVCRFERLLVEEQVRAARKSFVYRIDHIKYTSTAVLQYN